MDNQDFEELLSVCRNAVERFVYFKIPSKFDAEDVLQETYLAASKKFTTLHDKNAFKAWIVSIARNKCNDYFRSRAKIMEIPLEQVCEAELGIGRMGIVETSIVRETLNELADKDKEILFLYFFRDMPQADIAKKLGISLGTVKSRLHTAKQNFKNSYPYPPKPKGDIIMKKLPEIMPEYTITKSKKQPFEVVWEELMGWFIVPRLGEKLSWAIYDMPERARTEYDEMEVVGKAQIHGIEGVEIAVRTFNPMDCNSEGGQPEVSRSFIAQLTDTHCRYLAESHIKNDIRYCYTFLDTDTFLGNWGFGENNCGNETHLSVKGDIIRSGNKITTSDKPFLLDIAGAYTVQIGDKKYDTVCVMDVETYNSGVVSEQYLDRNGRTILWRRFNRDDWAFDRYGQKWSEKLPDNERITVNGKTYVHWYDCITDYIL